jgi:hypothetical protein
VRLEKLNSSKLPSPLEEFESSVAKGPTESFDAPQVPSSSNVGKEYVWVRFLFERLASCLELDRELLNDDPDELVPRVKQRDLYRLL